MHIFRSNIKWPLLYTSFLQYLLDLHDVRLVEENMLGAPKVFNHTAIKLIKYYQDKDEWYFMDVHLKYYDDKFMVHQDALECYLPTRFLASSSSSAPPPYIDVMPPDIILRCVCGVDSNHCSCHRGVFDFLFWCWGYWNQC